MPRVRRTYTNPYRMTFWGMSSAFLYSLYDPSCNERWHVWKTEALQVTWEQYKRREEWRWTQYLRRWDPYHYGNTFAYSMGYLSSTVLDKFMFGDRRYQDPPPYEEVADTFIAMAEATGIDPAKDMYENIKKVVDYYYPIDLDPNPEETKRVKKPEIRFVFQTDLDKVVEEEEAKPRPNSIARFLWYVPGYADYFNRVLKEAQEDEEKTLRSLSKKERQAYYEEMEDACERLALELNDYMPLLAHRIDRKLMLAKYLMDESNKEEANYILSQPGGVRVLFMKAGIIQVEPSEYAKYMRQLTENQGAEEL